MQLIIVNDKTNTAEAERLTGINQNKKLIEKLALTFDDTDFSLRQEKIDARMTCALNELKELFGEKEKLQDCVFGVTTAHTEEIPEMTPVARIETDVAQYIMVYDRLSLTNGNITNNNHDYGNYQSKEMMGRSALLTFFVKEFAKGLAKKVGNEMFAHYFPKDKDQVIKDEIHKLGAEIKDFLKELKHENLEDKLISIRVWLRETYSGFLKAYASLNNLEDIKAAELREDLSKRQSELQDITSSIVARISTEKLNDCDYLTRNKVMLYAACATMRIILIKEQLFWENELRNFGIKGYNNNVLSEELVAYGNTTAENIQTYMEGLRNGRLSKISKIIKYKEKLKRQDTMSKNSKTIIENVDLMKWEDIFESSNENDPFTGSKILSSKQYSPEGQKDANENQRHQDMDKEREEHFNAVDGLFETHIKSPLTSLIKRIEDGSKVLGSR